MIVYHIVGIMCASVKVLIRCCDSSFHIPDLVVALAEAGSTLRCLPVSLLSVEFSEVVQLEIVGCGAFDVGYNVLILTVALCRWHYRYGCMVNLSISKDVANCRHMKTALWEKNLGAELFRTNYFPV